MADEEKMRKPDICLVIFLIIALVCWFVSMFLGIIATGQRDKAKEELEFYKEESLREGICLWTDCEYIPSHVEGHEYTASLCYVYDTYKEQIIEVDVFDELLHCKIEVGDTIIYVVDKEYTDADMIGIIKGEKNGR